MTNEQIVALGQISCFLICAMGMHAENMQRSVQGDSMAYSDVDFFKEAENIQLALNQLNGGKSNVSKTN
jgi:hypothetical protein